jgi:hypothetical protein
MKFDPIGTSLVRYSFGGDTGAWSKSAPTSDPHRETTLSVDGVEINANRVSWAMWKAMRREVGYTPGWTFCRFGMRAGLSGEHCNQFLGIARGPFGIFGDTILVVDHRYRIASYDHLFVLGHLPTGFMFGVFTSLPAATLAAEVCQRMPGVDWNDDELASDLPRSSEVKKRACAAWTAAGLMSGENTVVAFMPEDTEHKTPLQVWMIDNPSTDERPKGKLS